MSYRIYKLAASLAVACTLVCGCDFLRSVAGRPTSRMIESALAQKQEADREAAIQDSLRQAEAAKAMAMADSIAKANAPSPSAVPEVGAGHAYYVVVGVFQSEKNAQKKVNQCREDGMSASSILFRSGMYGVIVNPTPTMKDAERMLGELKARKLCSKSAWILYN